MAIFGYIREWDLRSLSPISTLILARIARRVVPAVSIYLDGVTTASGLGVEGLNHPTIGLRQAVRIMWEP